MLLGSHVCTCLLVTSLALSLGDERPLLLILHSPRGMQTGLHEWRIEGCCRECQMGC